MYMNKEVIYLEPEDDITDILTKLQRAEQKLVALVPPKKATMLRSAVNMKLVAKAAKECEKVVVIVTADPAVIKLAMAAQIPVAKTLQSRPVVPTPEMVKASEGEEQIIDEELEEKGEKSSAKDAKSAKNDKNAAKMPGETSKTAATASEKKSADSLDLDSESLTASKKDGKKAKSPSTKLGKFDFGKYSKFIIPGVIAGIAVIVLAVWAFVFAPAVDITVAMNTSSSNFSEAVRFTTDRGAEDIDNGVFFAEKLENEQKFETEFTATGTEERGDKATGKVTLKYTANLAIAQGKGGYSVSLPKGTELESSTGLKYVIAGDGVGFSWDGDLTHMPQSCSISSCTETVDVTIEAANFGSTYDASTSTTWKPISITAKYNNGEALAVSISVTSKTAISGGTSKAVTVVTQADVNKAAEARDDNSATDGKEALMAKIDPENQIAINPSYSVEVGDLKPEPAVGEEVSDNSKVKLTAVTKYSIYVVDKQAVEEYINKKTNLASDQKIYSIGNPYFERFTKIEEEARLKTSIETGPTVTEAELREKVKGKKIGEVQSLLRSINGVSSVEVKPSFFWVSSVPKDDNKVTIKLTVEGN